MFLDIFESRDQQKIGDQSTFYNAWEMTEKQPLKTLNKFSKKVPKTWNCAQTLVDSEA